MGRRASDMTERILTEDEERAIRLVHDDFEGLSIGDAAKKMQMRIFTFVCLLHSAWDKAPQMAPTGIEQAVEQFDLKRHEHRIKEVF